MSRLGRSRTNDQGFTLVELTVAMTIFAILITIIGTTIGSSARSSEAVREVNNLNEEARLAMNRMSRELRQAKAVTGVSGSGGALGLTFEVDFNGNGTIEANAADPERLTYTWDAGQRRILLSATDTSGSTITQPILAREVNEFTLEYRSSRYQFDCNGDGLTVWQELDTPGACAPTMDPPIGNGSGTLDSGELPWIDSVVLTFTVLDGARTQHYRTQVDLRNAQ